MKIDVRKFARDLMGRKVKATRGVRGHHTLGHHTYDLRTPVVGWLVGFTYRRCGQTIRDPYEGTEFRSSGPSTLVFLVCQWPGRRPEHVDPSSIELLDDDHTMRDPTWREEDRLQMRDVMADHPRDKHGRWVRR